MSFSMEIKRVDPFIAAWSSSGICCFACKSVGIQFLMPVSSELLQNNKLDWQRQIFQFDDSEIVILSVKWSPFFFDTQCLLACLTNVGVYILNSRAQLVHFYPGIFYSVCWVNRELFFGSVNGTIYTTDFKILCSKPGTYAHVKLLVHDDTNNDFGVGFSDNSVYKYSTDLKLWTEIRPPSDNYVYDITFHNNELVVHSCGELMLTSTSTPASTTTTSTTIKTASKTLGHFILNKANEIALIHSDSRSTNTDSDFDGYVECACQHPDLPLKLIIVNSQQNEWNYPILSWLSMKLVISQTGERVGDIEYTPALWLYSQITSSTPTLGIEPELDISNNGGGDMHTDLTTRLQILFESKWFSYKRLQWYLNKENRTETVQEMRSKIADLLITEPVNSEIDRIIICMYKNEPVDFTVEGLGITDEFEKVESTNEVKSKAGREWNRCAITLFPLMTMDTKKSFDLEFTCYKQLPLINGQSESSKLATALFNAAKFCFLTGSEWD